MHDTEATITTSSRSSSARVAEWRMRSICSLMFDSFSIYVSVRGTYAFKGQPQYYRYTLRMHFYVGSAAVQIDHTYYENLTPELVDQILDGLE